MKKNRTLQIRYITPFASEDFFIAVKKGMQEAAALFGAECEFLGPEDADIAELLRLIRSAVADGCDGIAVSLVDPDRMNPVIREAKEAGVPAVAFNIGGDEHSPVLSSVCQDFVTAGRRAGEKAAERIPDHTHVLLTLHDDVAALRMREKGIREGLRGKDLVFTTIVSGNDPEIAAESIRKALQENPDIKAVIGTGQSDTHGAGIVSGETSIYAAGFDVCGEILRMIRERTLDFTVDQQPYIQGFYPLMQLTQYIRYGLVPCDIDSGSGIIDEGNRATGNRKI